MMLRALVGAEVVLDFARTRRHTALGRNAKRKTRGISQPQGRDTPLALRGTDSYEQGDPADWLNQTQRRMA